MDPSPPWHAFQSPLAQWSALPSFLFAEALFIGLAIMLLVHAVRSDRAHLLLWVGALVAGTANDLIFMALPLVDNFWHAQATVMLTPRLPLYIPCVYVSFLYLPTVAVSRLRLPLLSAAALSGLVAVLFYAPFDITGAKMLWWTWHDTDLPIADRILGAPASSTLWVLTFAGTFSLLTGWMIRRDPAVSWSTFAKGLALVAALSTVVMVVQMTILQPLDGGAPGYVALGVAMALYAAIALFGARRAQPEPPKRVDAVPLVGATVHFVVLALVMAAFDPSTHRSTGIHQEVGECYVDAEDVTGLTRHRYLCARDFSEDFTFACLDAMPDEGSTWYTVCGRPHASFWRWMLAIGALGGLGVAVFAGLFGATRRRRASTEK